MSTRANIIIKDDADQLIFYRHCDGYPEGTMPTLNKFLDLVKGGLIRDNVGQAAGWLIIIGHIEQEKGLPESQYNSWKVGAYEPTTCIHSDIEYKYTIDLVNKMIITEEV